MRINHVLLAFSDLKTTEKLPQDPDERKRIVLALQPDTKAPLGSWIRKSDEPIAKTGPPIAFPQI